jgi:hypothetical protein
MAEMAGTVPPHGSERRTFKKLKEEIVDDSSARPVRLRTHSRRNDLNQRQFPSALIIAETTLRPTAHAVQIAALRLQIFEPVCR